MTEKPVAEQRRGRAIAMTADERNTFLGSQRTCRLATVGGDGAPHLTPLRFVWDDESIWVTSLVRSQRWTNLQRDPRISVLVDAGDDYMQLRGVELIGRVEPVGSAPRTPDPDPALEVPEQLFGEKYAGGTFVPDGTNAWVRLVPDKMVSWDFRKLASL